MSGTLVTTRPPGWARRNRSVKRRPYLDKEHLTGTMEAMKLPVFATLILLSPLGLAATGTVFHDLNANGVRDQGEPGLSGIPVSNQKEIVRTNPEGRWELPHDEDTIFFVVKPRGWTPPLSEDKTPQFYYIHKPAGSPTKLRYQGVAPTGDLPASIDFALTRHRRNPTNSKPSSSATRNPQVLKRSTTSPTTSSPNSSAPTPNSG